jgi:hypothetical protein
MRNDSVLSRAVRSGSRTGEASFVVSVFRRLRAMPARGYAGAALAAVLTGIVVNALTLQHERHPAPFFAAPRQAVRPAPRAATPTSPEEKPEEPAPAPVLPPVRPADLAVGVESTPKFRRSDAIGDILREESGKEAQRSILAAQNALIKLGYSVRADGLPSAATSTALHEFERAHSLPLSTEITPHLLRRLAAAANAAER